MKKTLIAVGCMVATVGALAQAQVNFANIVLPNVVNAPVYDVDGTTKLAGSDYMAQLYVGTAADSLSPVGSPVEFKTGAGAGYFLGGTVTLPVDWGTTIYAQVRAWYTGGGTLTSYEAANKPGGKVGESNILTIQLPPPATPPPLPVNLVGLESFSLHQVQVIPEPSTIALGLLGAAAFLLRRRK